ncbi:DUF6588 family protein [Croceivirga sp. JEA036]|uniref:DUF6588 family protein n=1 Tax=Croceivirga sp. JEA036 TaxID=2721162 RepID=UPI001438E31E|nr:DUF6588 family protein [Croceivirga sp. JEA036]NJB37353.1 hypothetical protein [Croceivirga sp. JEA036]
MKYIALVFAFASFSIISAQTSIGNLFAAGVEDAERFANAYFMPATEATIFSMSNGWYNTADAKPLGGFEISIVGNITGFKNKDDKQAFNLDTADYENIQFADGSTSKLVSTALGDIEGVRVLIEDESGLFSEEFELPSGLAGENINFVPTGFVQASVGLIKGMEVKARFLPKIATDDVKIGLFGAGLQYDFTKLLPADKILPVAISAVIGYTNLNGEYNFTDANLIAGDNQRIDANFKTWNFSAVVSTREIPVINFYGGLGYITGTSETAFLGTYEANGPFFTSTVTDPFTLKNDASGIAATLGTKIKIGFFRLNVDYNIAEFNTLTAGMHFGFR